MDTPSITCMHQLSNGDSEEVLLTIPPVTIKATEKPRVNTSTTTLPVKLTTITTTIVPISVSSPKFNSSLVQPQPSPSMYLKKESVSYRKIDIPMVVDAIEYTCLKMDYKSN